MHAPCGVVGDGRNINTFGLREASYHVLTKVQVHGAYNMERIFQSMSWGRWAYFNGALITLIRLDQYLVGVVDVHMIIVGLGTTKIKVPRYLVQYRGMYGIPQQH